jgi:hypothetical protein
MTDEERAIKSLPPYMRAFMARLALQGWRFSYVTSVDSWRRDNGGWEIAKWTASRDNGGHAADSIGQDAAAQASSTLLTLLNRMHHLYEGEKVA